MSQRPLLRDAMDCLARIRASGQWPEEDEHLWDAHQALLFISSTGQRYAFEDFLASLEAHHPPPVVAAFRTREEADAWLKAQDAPPDSTFVLIADQHYSVVYIRDLNHRRLVRLPVIEYHLGRLKRSGLPAATAAFETRQEAETWFSSQPQPPPQSVLTIAGEAHLAVYHPNIGHRALYPFSIARDEEPEEGPAQEP